MITYTAEQTAINRKIWTDALRSDAYKQGTDALRFTPADLTDDTYCCLGVGCELAVEAGILERTDRGYSAQAGESSDAGELLPPRAVVEWLGLADEWGTLVKSVEYGSPCDVADRMRAGELTSLNDAARFTFEQIADQIDAGNVKLTEVAA